MRGQTALITGASSGFGAEFARQLAALGADVVLVARRRERLELLADELRAAHGVTATVVALDLTAASAPHELADELAAHGITVQILVNNAGFGTYGPFGQQDATRIAAEVQLNVVALTLLSREFFAQLVAAEHGILINVSSAAAYQPMPGVAVYAATKAYVRSLTEALWSEAQGTNLRVLALAPGPSRTEFFEAAGSEKFNIGQMLTVPEVVTTALQTLARRSPPPSVVPGLRNKVTTAAVRFVPRRLLLALVNRMTSP